MANNKIQVKRTNVAGRTANVTSAGNAQYIDAGEFALNMADQILYTSNGSTLITVGANLVNQRITNSLTLDNDKNIFFRTVNTSASVGFRQQSDDNFVFYSTNTAYGQRAVWSIFANSITSAFSVSVPTTFNSNVTFGGVAVSANGSTGTAGQFLTTNGTSTYWSTATASVNVNAQYVWTNTQTFQANISFTGNNISFVTNTGSVLFNGSADANWRIGRNTGGTTKFFYTGNTIDIIAANSALEGVAIGFTGNTYLETGYAGTFTRLPVYVGNTVENVATTNTTLLIQTNTTVNSTHTASLLQIANSTSITNVTASGIQVYSDAATNTNITSALIRVSNSTSNARITAATVAVQSNTTVNAQMTASLVQVSNSTSTANLSALALTIGTSVVNSTVIAAGANVFANTTAVDVGNTVVSSINLTLGGQVTANGGVGTAGQVLTSGATGNAYWTTPTVGTVTSVATGNGITGGTITSTGTLVATAGPGVVVNTSGISVLANNGLSSNSTGVFAIPGNGLITSNSTGLHVGPGNGITVNSTTVAVLANTGIVSNATGTYVNATYIATLNANSATQLATARTLTIGSTGKSFSGTNNITWSLTEIGAEAEQTSGVPRANLGTPTVREAALFDAQFTNKTDRFNIANIWVETSTDDITWTDTLASDQNKRRLVGGDVNLSAITIPYNTPYFRIRFRATDYVYLNSLYSYFATQGHTTAVQIFKKHDSGSWTQHTSSTTQVNSWPGHLYLPFSTIPFHPTGTLGTHFHEVYVLFIPTWNVSFPSNPIAIYNTQLWGGYPSGRRNIYSTDEFGNVTFPANVTVTSTLIGTANNASFLGGTAAASYVQNTDSRTLSGNLVISGTSFTPSSNAILLGNSTQRWVLSANTGSFSGAVSGITTLAAGNTTITGFANVTTSVNSALLTVGTSFIANTTGAYHTGTVNAASYTVGTSFTANSTVVNAVSYRAGTLLVANSTVSNATHLAGSTFAAPPVIGSGTANGISLTYANVSGQVNTATLYAATSANIASIVQANSLGVHVGANVVANTTALRVGNTTLTTTNATFGGTIAANGSIGTAGQVMTSGAAGNVYWTTPTVGTVTSVATGNGISGGPITSTGTLVAVGGVGTVVNTTGIHVLANTGIVSNTTGTFVNAAYIATIAANNASFLGGTAAASYVQNTDSRTLSGNLVISGTSFTPSSNAILLGNSTQRWVLSANTGSFSGAVSGITTLAAGNTTITGFANVTTSVNSALFTVGTAFTANSTVVNAVSYYAGTLLVANSTVSNATHLGGVAAANYARTDAADNFDGIVTFNANAVLTKSLSANGSFGTAGQVLTSGATGNAHWATAVGGGYYKGGSTTLGTLASQGQNIFRVNANTLNTNTTFAAGENGQATGPIAVASGVTLTIQTGARVSIV